MEILSYFETKNPAWWLRKIGHDFGFHVRAVFLQVEELLVLLPKMK